MKMIQQAQLEARLILSTSIALHFARWFVQTTIQLDHLNNPA